ncbi:tetratricopeptide repeat protein [Actinomadura sp. 1N219]|uniref:tetratricopeptide repeat protein n=1 Tax=Actinomadura sp. 1N219 TaxID=3375152 RepID=UPI0037BAF9FF
MSHVLSATTSSRGCWRPSGRPGGDREHPEAVTDQVIRTRALFAAGLAGSRRRQAAIQFASTLRNLGRAGESVALLAAERDAVSDELDDAVTAFLALALTDLGRDREAAALALGALSRHLPRYNRSLAHYAKALMEN